MLDDLRGLLMALGLAPKEADVYLAMLELGPTNIQAVAEKASVNRSTTYVQLETLMEKGLASSYDRMGKTYYVAEHPDRLQSLVGKRLVDAEAAKRQVEDGLPKLKAIFNAIPGKPAVRFSEGSEALVRTREEIAGWGEPVLNFYAVDQEMINLSAIQDEQRRQAFQGLKGSKILMAIKPGYVPPVFDREVFDARVVDYARAPFGGELIISSRRVIWLHQHSAGATIVIEHPEFAATMRTLFLDAWERAVPWTPPDEWGK